MESPESAEVDLEAARSAAAWCDFLEGHAAKVYAAELHPERAAAHALADKIKSGAIGHGDAVRDIYRPHWSGISTPDTVWPGLKLLEENGWLRIIKEDTGGRPAEIIELHPELRRAAA